MSGDFLAEASTVKSLFTIHFRATVFSKLISTENVVQKFKNSKVTTEEENRKLDRHKVLDEKLGYLMQLINDKCNENDLRALECFVTVLKATANIELAKTFDLIYQEREKVTKIMYLLSKAQSSIEELNNEIMTLRLLLHKKEDEMKTDTSNPKNITSGTTEELEEIRNKMRKLEEDVKRKQNLIDSKENELKQYEKKLQKYIRESDHLRLEYDQQKNKDEKKINELEKKLNEKENHIIEVRRERTMSDRAVGEQLRIICNEQSLRLDAQSRKLEEVTSMMTEQRNDIKQLNENFARLCSIFEDNVKTVIQEQK